MKLAIFQSTDTEVPFSMVRMESEEKYTDMVRMTEYVDVEFVPRPVAEFVPAQVESLDKQIAAVTKEFGQKLAALQTRKADLLALTDQREPL